MHRQNKPAPTNPKLDPPPPSEPDWFRALSDDARRLLDA